MGPIGCPETSVRTPRCVITQKSAVADKNKSQIRRAKFGVQPYNKLSRNTSHDIGERADMSPTHYAFCCELCKRKGRTVLINMKKTVLQRFCGVFGKKLHLPSR